MTKTAKKYETEMTSGFVRVIVAGVFDCENVQRSIDFPRIGAALFGTPIFHDSVKSHVNAARRVARAALNQSLKAKREAAHREAAAIVAGGKCPECGAGIRRNSSLAGWYQCEQFGAIGFRKDSSKPACSWQTFTE